MIKKLLALIIAFTISPFLTAGIVFADIISNNLDGTIDASVENTNLVVGGGNASVKMMITQENGDGKNGCNLTGQTSLVVSINSSNPAIATVSPSTFTFNPGCNDELNVVVTPVGTGVATVTLTQITNTTSGTFNLVPASFTATVTADTEPPVLTLPSAMTVEATSASGATVSYVASATDANPTNPVVTCTPASGSVFPLGLTTVNCSATDAYSNVANGSFTVNVVDTTAPAISSMPSNVTMEAVGPTGRVVTYTNPTATDIVDGTVPVTCTPASGSMFPLGDTAVSCTAVDAHGNSASSVFHVVVQDTTGPSLILPSTITVEAVGPSGTTVSFSPTATDIVSGSLPVSCTPASGSMFAITTTSVACSSTDGAGNTSNGSFDVVVQDTTAPVLASHADVTVEATSDTGAVVTYTSPTATDSVDGDVAVSCVPASGSTFALGDTTVVCTAVDAHGNSATSSFVVHVLDTTPPVFTSTTPSDMTLEATGPTGAVATFTSPTASDLVDTDVTVVCESATNLTSGSMFPLGATLVTCTATDNSGNFAVSEFTVTVVDTQAPVAVCGTADGLWHATDVSIACTASDSGSGLAVPADATFSLTTTVPSGTEDNNASTNSHVVCDVAGNCSTAGPVAGNMIDKANPAITLTAPQNGATYTIHQTVNANYACSDLGSGVATCVGSVATGSPIDTATVGTKSFSVTSTDNVSNSTNTAVSYLVDGYHNFVIKNPVALTAKEFKKPSTIPVKFTIKNFDGSVASLAVATLLVNGVPAIASGSSNTGNFFRYDASAGQYIFNLSTKSLTLGTNVLTITLDDGSVHTVTIIIK